MLDDYDEIIATLTRRILASAAGEAGEPELRAGTLALIAALTRLFEAQQGAAPASCLGPLLPGATLVGGARVPGTSLELEPSQAAYCVAWLCDDAPLGALLPLADYLARRAVLTGARPLRLAGLLQACAQAHAIAASLALPPPHQDGCFAAPLAARVAIAGVAARLLGASDAELAAAVSLAFAEGLAPQAGGPRTCAAAASAAVRVALLARAGAPGVPRVLTARPGGLEASLLGGGSITLHAATEPGAAAASEDPLLHWHRFELAVRARFNERAAARLLAAVHADAPLAALPLQSFVALLVRAS